MTSKTTSPTDERAQSAARTADRLLSSWTGSVLFARAKGAVLTDLNGRDYVDFDAAGGALLLGHADERVVVAVNKAATRGASFAGPTEHDVRLAELITSRLPSADKVHLCSTADQARAWTLNLLRTATGRPRIISCTPAVAGADVIAAPYNDPDAVGRLLEEQAAQVAGVVLEPIATTGGLQLPDDGYLAALRQLGKQHEVPLVYDETVTGFRISPGGAAAVQQVWPDVVILGGALGGGLALAAVAGRRDLLRQGAQRGLAAAVRTPGLSLAAAAGLAVLQAISETGFYDTLEGLAEGFATSLAALTTDGGQPLGVTRVGSILSVALPAGAPGGDAPWSAFRDRLLGQGVWAPPRADEPWFVSAAHDEDVLRTAARAAGEALTEPGPPTEDEP